MNSNLLPYSLDWGNITAEGYNNEKNEILLIFNVASNGQANANNVLHYVVGRLKYGSFNFPENALVKAIFDIRGQKDVEPEKLEGKIMNLVKESGIKNSVLVEFVKE